MIGNLTNNIYKRNKITLVDLDFFILSLLKDAQSVATNTTLSTKSVVNFAGDLNLGDLYIANGSELLITFTLNREDPRNANLSQTIKDGFDQLKVAYKIGLLVKKETANSQKLLKAGQELLDLLTNNWNGEVATPTNYIVTVPSGNILNSPLTQNQADPYPEMELLEDPEQRNYLTLTLNILFIVNKSN